MSTFVDARGCGRYAPSPTGPLHLGNLQTALAAWLQARLRGSLFVLRIEDLDQGRCRARWTEHIVNDLRRIGIDWDIGPGKSADTEYLQSRRTERYREALDTLARQGRVFPCRCSRKDLRDLASAPHGPLGPVYPGTCRGRSLSPLPPWKDGSAGADSVRLLIDEQGSRFVDEVRGAISCDPAAEVGDVVVYRRDGVFAYHLAVVVDDIAAGVTDVVRGADLVWSTFPQLSLYRALGAPPPCYWHAPLLLDERGRRMSKRAASVGLDQALAGNRSLESVVGGLAAGLGLVAPGSVLSAGELLQQLDEKVFRDALRGAADGQAL